MRRTLQMHYKLGSMPVTLTLRFNPSAMKHHDPLDELAANARTSVQPVERAAGRDKEIEAMRSQSRIDARSVAPEGDNNFGRLRVPDPLGVDGDMASVTAIFVGIAQEVVKDLRVASASRYTGSAGRVRAVSC